MHNLADNESVSDDENNSDEDDDDTSHVNQINTRKICRRIY